MLLSLSLCLVLAADARPTVAVVPFSGEEAWIGMALADNLSNRLLVHSRLDAKSLERIYPLNVYGWRQVWAAARGEGLTTSISQREAAVVTQQLGADAALVGSYKATDKGLSIAWSLYGLGGKPKSGKLDTTVDKLAEATESLAGVVLEAVGHKGQGMGSHKVDPLPVAALKPYGEALLIIGRQSLDPQAQLVLPKEEMLRARALLTAATDARPSFARAWVERGIISSMLGELAKAEEELVQAMAQAGEFDPATALGLYYLYDRQNKRHEAVKILAEATSTHLGFLQGLGYLGEAYGRLGQGHESLQTFSTYASRVPKSPWAAVRRAAALARIGKQDLAVTETEGVLKRFPASIMVLSALAARQIDAQRFDDAKQTIDKGLAMQPGHPVFLARLAFLELEQGRAAEAASQAEKAVKAIGDGRGEPLAGYAHLNLAHALGVLGKRDEAIVALKQAAALGINSEELRYLTRDARMKDVLADPRCPPVMQKHDDH